MEANKENRVYEITILEKSRQGKIVGGAYTMYQAKREPFYEIGGGGLFFKTFKTLNPLIFFRLKLHK